MAPVSSVLIANDEKLGQALTYLFSVVLKGGLNFVRDTPTTADQIDGLRGADVVMVHLAQEADGLELIASLKKLAERPVIIALYDKGQSLGAKAFLAGADDVVSWPASLHELALRTYARLGRSLEDPVLADCDRNWDTEAFIVERAGLSVAEAQILRVLYSNAGEIVSRDALSIAVDDRPWRYGDRKFDVHVGKIRKKLKDSFGAEVSLATVRATGYQFRMNRTGVFAQS
ncbi:Transcriptional regulatory protein, C terminal [Sulfitobacter brevis]|uniref:Transcriptional regulatory protein, C terminal n=1 Tax=Sulfitobacter brevis TaxID=74348 RepID=A0A1I2DXR8_9RHOB|nr:winged helix-turn-helix domain-containing protein [Sulfitobacter brevis]SFE85188.1 Transcriptional regulatory protein, C terminal [Sulfitobacter brevis]